jgi:hypothetical protein
MHPTAHLFHVPASQRHAVAQIAMFLTLSCTVMLGLSQRAGDFIISALFILLRTCMEGASLNGLSPVQATILDQIPTSLTTTLAKFNLDGKFTAFAVCPECHCTYSPSKSAGDYPATCTYQVNPEVSPCGEPLLEENAEGSPKPIKTFFYHSFHDFVANLLARDGIEKICDDICDETFNTLKQGPRFMQNIFHGTFMRTFQGPLLDSKTGKPQLFIHREGELRLVFSMNVDFFSPEGQTVRGPMTSCGIISMVCLNLPLHECFKPENMYIAGIIPGPREPREGQLNHYLRPLINDLCESYEHGVFFTKTAESPSGRLSRSALVVSVNDLPAARKVSQLASYNSHFFCSTCNGYDLSTRKNTDYQNWVSRDDCEMRKVAFNWRDASTSAEQKSLWDKYGLRWSEMWRLPYWKPTKQLVVDSMHCIFLGLVSTHVRTLLRATDKHASAKVELEPAFHFQFTTPVVGDTLRAREANQVKQIHRLLLAAASHASDPTSVSSHMNHLEKKLRSQNVAALKFICQDIGCVVQSKPRIVKNDYVIELINWVSFNNPSYIVLIFGREKQCHLHHFLQSP